MDRPVQFLLLLASAPFLAFLFHWAFARLLGFATHRWNPLGTAVLSITISSLLIFWTAWAVYLRLAAASREFSWYILFTVLVIAGLSFSYFQLFAMTETARRIRILRELFLRGSMTLKEFQSEYGPSGILSVRLERMVTLGQLGRSGVRYQLKGRLLLWVGNVMSFWSRVLGYSERNGF